MGTIDVYSLVTDVLDEVAQGPRAKARDMARSLVGLCRGEGDEEHAGLFEVQRRLAACATPEILELIRYLTARFHLLNNAEKSTIARINHEREQTETIEKPRAESIGEGLHSVARTGLSGAQALRLLSRLDIQPTLTAHPTETRRRSLQIKLREVSELLGMLQEVGVTPAAEQRLRSRLHQVVLMLTVTDDVRVKRLGVLDEVQNGLHFLTTTIWDSVPLLAHDLVRGLRGHYPGEADAFVLADLPAVLRYRTWMGGDRDGNPRVTSEVTRETLAMLAAAAREKIGESLEQLRQELSLSDRRIDVPQRLLDSINQHAAFNPADPDVLAHARHEPFRVRIMQMANRVRGDATYGASSLLADLEEIRGCLREIGLKATADEGPLAELMLRVRVFGLHLASLDIRQHSAVHERAVGELIRVGGVNADYAALDEPARLELLRRELTSPRPLLPPGATLSDETAEVLGVLRVVAEAQQREPDAVRAYVVSMTHSASDLLEVLLLMKEAGLYRFDADAATSTLDVVPLLETVADLQHGPDLINALAAEPVYMAHLRARGRAEAADGAPFQELMLGYSDSNKDGGYLMANVALRHAQERLCEACRSHAIEFRLFHGRGGTVGRGGGRANRAILSMPLAAQNGRIRFTEQGEVISFRYGVRALARRHLEQIVSAMIVSTHAGATPAPTRLGDASSPLERLAERSMRVYRDLIEHADFWPWFLAVSPVGHIGGLPIASRPVARAGGGLTFDSLRAIPWVFSWIQMRYLAPSWYGLGAAMAELRPDELRWCADAYQHSMFFRTVINNAKREMARARLPAARFYALQHEHGEPMHDRLAADFNAARSAIRAITGLDGLLDDEPVIARSIIARNPYTDLLNLSQVVLLGRAREETGPENDPRLQQAIFASINAIAAAMQSTG